MIASDISFSSNPGINEIIAVNDDVVNLTLSCPVCSWFSAGLN